MAAAVMEQLPELPTKEALLEGLDIPQPDPVESTKIIAAILKKREKERKAQADAERRRADVAREAAELAQKDPASDAVAQMAELQRQLGLDMGAALEEYQETQQVLFPVALPQEPAAACQPDYMEGVDAALGALGVDASFLPDHALASEGQATLLREGVRCGFVQHETLRRGRAHGHTVETLTQLLAYSPDMEVAGAAFVALLTLLGDPGLQRLTLDATYDLPPAASPVYTSLPNPCTVDSLPSIRSLYEALVANGYSPPATSGPNHGKQQHKQAAAGAAGSSSGGGSDQGTAPMRIQAVKLILQTVVAVCRYCQQNSALAASVMDREALIDFLLAVALLGLDPCERLLLDDLDDAMLALLGAFEEGDWQRRLPHMAAELGRLAQSHTAHLKVLKRLPAASSPRALALQQLSGALLLERVIPTKGGAGAASAASAIKRSRDGAVDPTAVIAAQPWFSNPKGLVAGATSGGHGAVPKGGYHISQLELLLKVCHLLLWPHMQRYGEGATDTIISLDFLHRWCGQRGFLQALNKSIKAVAVEDHSVKYLAQYMDEDYKTMMEAHNEAMRD